MSGWDNFKKTLGNFADKTVTKTRELTGTASLKIKIANKEADRDIEYKRLGKLTYAKLKASEGHSTEELTAKISESLDKLDKITSELNALKSEDEERKAEKEASKKASDGNADDTLNTDSLATQGEEDSNEAQINT